MSRALCFCFCVAIAACSGPTRSPSSAPPGTALDAFDDLAAWRASASDGVASAIRAVPGVRGGALRLELDLSGTAGYAVARRALPLEFPENFELAFELRGDVPINNFELKLIDASGDNVWWFHRKDFAFPKAWQRITVKRRQIEFAWGPIADKTLRRIAAIEIVVATGQSEHSGGKGWIEIDSLALRPLPVDGPPPPLRASATSSAPGAAPASAVDGRADTAWRSDPAARDEQALTIDLGRERELGGAIVRWADNAFAAAYAVELSLDGAAWRAAGAVTGGNGGADPFWLPDATARWLRVRVPAGAAIADVEVLPVADGATATAFVAALARRAPRGWYPRGMSGEQPYWTVVGVDGGKHSGLLSEDGALELRGGGASIEPFVQTAASAASWATAPEIRQSLEAGYLPIPSVVWRTPAWELRVTAVADGNAAASQLVARYTLRNLTSAPLPATLVLAVRPLQVNPPQQFLNITGGVSPVHELAWNGASLAINGAPAVVPIVAPDRVSLWPLHAAAAPWALAATPAAVSDRAGLASGALGYDLALAPHGEASVAVVVPWPGAGPPPARRPAAEVARWFDGVLAAARARWHDKLDRVAIRVPEAGRALVETLRSSLAYMLVSRDGPILRPGTRSYARAWIRDGAMISEGLLRLGHPEIAVDFLRWYAPYQYESGKVPCCVDRHGAGPVPEHDSHGQLIYLVAEIYRYTGDRALVVELWPRIEAAARYMEQLRQSERTAANQTPARRALFGLLPPSISHEGYSAKAAYSYWDDFWALRGYKDAAWLAAELGHTDAAARLAAQRDEFRRELLASVSASAAAHGVDYIPGAADLGDFDATSTTIALAPAGEHQLPPDLLRATFERYWRELSARRTSTAWAGYTPYELRVVGTFVRLGWRDRAHEALAAFFADRRPAAWNQWAEVVGRVAREPRFIGDMPHAWVHSDFARSALDLFAYDRESDGALVLAAGIPASWLAGDGVAIERLRTRSGPLGYTLARRGDTVALRIDAGRVPPGGLVLPWPFAGEAAPGATRINGRPARWRDNELVITARPATVAITLQRRPP